MLIVMLTYYIRVHCIGVTNKSIRQLTLLTLNVDKLLYKTPMLCTSKIL